MKMEVIPINNYKKGKKHSEKIIFPMSATLPNLIVKSRNEIIEIENTDYRLDIYGPQDKLESYSSLYIKNGYKLVAYLSNSGSGGNGYVYAIPKDSNPLDIKKSKNKDDLIHKPCPKYHLSNFMLGIEGDKTPLSYLQASMLYHELCEYGASWHGVSWGRDIILPYNNAPEEMLAYKWDMLKEEPEIIEPHFYYNEKTNPIVVFYTINDIYTITLKKYTHTFDKESYNVNINVEIIAEAGMGIIF